jgi:phosphonate transport system substrate-binding protein
MSIRKLMIALAVVALFVAACGSDTEDTTTTAAAADTTTTTEMMEETTTTTMADMHPDWPDKIVFGFVPSQEAGELQDDVDTFASILSDALGIEVDGIVSSDYPALGAAMGNGQADMGAFGPAGYVLANRTYNNLELLAQSVRYGDATYHAQWYTNDPSVCGGDPVEGAYYYDADNNVVPVSATETPALQVGYNGDGTRKEGISAGLRCPDVIDVNAVVGGTIAFPGETSTSGYIFPQLQLLAEGITDDQYDSLFFGGSHDLAVTAVYNGDADFGLSFDDARGSVTDDFPDVGEKVIVFNISPRIANDVIAVRSDLPADLKDAIFSAMSDYIQTEDGAAVMESLYSWTDLIRADATTEASLVPISDAIDQLGYGG